MPLPPEANPSGLNDNTGTTLPGWVSSVGDFLTSLPSEAGSALHKLVNTPMITPSACAMSVMFCGATAMLSASEGNTTDTAVRQVDLDTLAANGVKFTPQNVVATGTTPSGQVVFLETGSSSAGLQHIIEEHGAEFANMGVPPAQNPEVVMQAVTEGNIVGYRGSGTGRPIYKVTVNGQPQRVAVTVGSDGFIVGANPQGCQVRKNKVMADYQCHPLWDMSPGMYGDVAPNTLPISVELQQRLEDWARVFDETLDISDPASSGFKSAEAEAAFKARGIQLAEQLQKELGVDFLVTVKV